MEELITEKDIIMRGGAAAATSGYAAVPVAVATVRNDTYDVEDNPDATLLEILDKGINDIVIQIKTKLGRGKIETNKNAKLIVEMLDTLSTDIANSIAPLTTDDNGADHTRVKVSKVNDKYIAERQPKYFGNELENPVNGTEAVIKEQIDNNAYSIAGWNGIDINGTHFENKIDMINLDSKYDNNINPIILFQNADTDLTQKANQDILSNRLNNCQLLEMLYLVKHEELMKTFAFTLNLFDKYKYSIKILLFVLKNLVNKKGTTTGPVPAGTGITNIKLPKTLIPNIMKLLEDQKQVQDVITSMQNTLDENSDIYTDSTEAVGIRTAKLGKEDEIEAISKLSNLSTDKSTQPSKQPPSAARMNHATKNNASPDNANPSKKHDFTGAPTP